MPRVEFKNLPPAEAVAYFEGKGYRTTFGWAEMMAEEHGAAFTVAKVARLDLLADIRQAVDQAIREGWTTERFQRELRPTLVAKGWWGRQEMTDPLTGERREVQLGSPNRLAIIYDTNLRTSHAAGRWEQIQRVKADRPYLRYCAVLDRRTRPAHRGWNGTVLPVDHSFWSTHYPPNGWRCRCFAVSVSERELARRGEEVSADPDVATRPWVNNRTGEVSQVPVGIDPGFGYNPGRGRLASLTPPPLDRPLSTIYTGDPAAVPPPPARPIDPARLLPQGLAPEQYARAFLREFGADIGRPVVWKDALGEPMVISDSLFRYVDGRWKVTKRQNRGTTILALADALRDPDEIWWQWQELHSGGTALRRRYLRRATIDGQDLMLVFEIGKDGWVGVTGFDVERRDYFDRQRRGTLAWRRSNGE